MRRHGASFKSQGIEAWRLYSHDIPTYPYLIDLYRDYCVLYDQGSEQESSLITEHHDEARAALVSLLQIPPDHVIFKVRRRQKGTEQYTPNEEASGKTIVINEGKLRFEVNLGKYLDTGLFLDHRPLRRELVRISHGKNVLNLFSYTGSLSVAAAAGSAAKVTSLDMSATYLDWASRNFELNKPFITHHELGQVDVVEWLRQPPQGQWDIILLDPPSFSNSKRMQGVLDIERDHVFLIEACLKRLAPQGKLFFSTNKRRFKLDSQLEGQAKEITRWTVPPDFADSAIHRAWEFIQA